MQQLYRCTSWWLANYPAKQPILVCRRLSTLLESYFVSNYIKLLQDTIGLQVVQKLDDKNNPFAVVRSKETGKWEFDIDLTDFAFLDPQQQLRASLFSTQASDDTQTAVIDSTCRHTNHPNERFPRIAILNRKLESGRHLLNANTIASSIEETYGNQTIVSVTYFEKKTFLEQIQFFAETDIVISPHGAQLTGMAFLPKCASLLELFPLDYLNPDYFGSLAAAMNISHSFFYMGDNNEDPDIVLPYEKYHFIRVGKQFKTHDTRHDSLCPNVASVVSAVVNMVNNWQECCSSTTATTTPTQSLASSTVVTSSAFGFNPTIDIISVAGRTSSTKQLQSHPGSTLLVDAQAKTFGSHPLVRNYYRTTTKVNETNTRCFSTQIEQQQEQAYSSCIDPNDHAESNEELYCAQMRMINGLNDVLEKYKTDGTAEIPDYLMLIQDDAYLNIDTLVSTFQKSYLPHEHHIIAGCTNRLRMFDKEKMNEDNFVYPIGRLGSIVTRGAIERIIQPIYCNVDDHDMNRQQQDNAFNRWACWRLEQNYLGEKIYFEDGMSIGELMYTYSSKTPEILIQQWNHSGYCLYRSEHTMGYFFNYYHFSVPDWILNGTKPTDQVRKEYGFKKLAGSTEIRHTGIGGECDNSYINCNPESRICHSLNSEQMIEIHHLQQ
jgi:Glycosyltransferase 61